MDQPDNSHARELLDFAVLHSSAIFYVASNAGERPLRYISPNVERLTGHRAARFADSPTFGRQLIHPEDRARYEARIARLAEEPEGRVEYRFRTAWGAYLWMRDELRFLPAPEGNLFVGCMHDITAEKLSEAQLQETLTMVQALVGNALDAVVAMDEEGLVVEFNPAAERLFGYRREAAVGRPLVELIVPPATRAQHSAGLARVRATGSTALSNRRLQVEAQHRDGHTFPVELTIAQARFGERKLFVGEIRDISERVAAQAERARLTRLLEEAIAGLPVAFCMSGPDDRILFCNELFARLYDLRPRELIGQTREETIALLIPRLASFDGKPLRDGKATRVRLAERLRAADRDPVEMATKDGRWMLVWSTRTSDDHIINVRTDITPIKRAESAERQSHEVIRQVLDACPIPVGMTRAEDGLVLYESPASKALYGRDPEDRPTYAVSSFVDPADRQAYLERLRREGQVEGFEVRMRRGDGSEFLAALSARLVEFRGEEAIVSSTFDLTERKQMEREMAYQRDILHQSEKMAAMGSLLAGVAHELNNPLSVVVGQALLMKETATEPRVAERAEKIGAAADRCARIVKTFLAMARQRPQRSEPLNLNEVVSQALELTGYALRASNIEVRLKLAPNLPAVWGDPDQLVQVIANLVINAENALRQRREGRRLTITSSLRGARGEVTVKVKDNGPGVPPELQRRIFEPFFTTKEVGSGTGIGLALCHRIVEAHRGRIKLESEPGKGASFALSLPAAELPDRNEPEAPAGLDGGKARRALVIDDEPEVAEVIEQILVREGFTVALAASGEEALSRLARERFDVILSDLRMPGLDGCRLFEHLQERQPALIARLGFVTGDSMSPDARRFLDRAGRPVVEKPITPSDIRQLIQVLLETVPQG